MSRLRPIITGKSRTSTSRSKSVGWIMPGMPMTASILNMFEPITLPMAMSASSFLTAVMDAASSGKLVPIAIIVRPMIKSLRPKCLATMMAHTTSKYAPAKKSHRPRKKRKMDLPIFDSSGDFSGSSLSYSLSKGSVFADFFARIITKIIAATSPTNRNMALR